MWKQKWMANEIYELIMLSKVSVIAKLELLITSLIFWNNGTNTLDIAQVFGLRLSGRCRTSSTIGPYLFA